MKGYILVNNYGSVLSENYLWRENTGLDKAWVHSDLEYIRKKCTTWAVKPYKVYEAHYTSEQKIVLTGVEYLF
jgi:hypothetical protein